MTQRITILTYIFISFSVFGYGQNAKNVDSLINLLKHNTNRPDKLSLYDKICYYYLDEVNIPKATQYADSLTALGQKLDDKKALALSQLYYGVINQYESKYAAAEKNLKTYLEYAEKHGDSTKVADGLQPLAMVHAYWGNYEKSLAILYRLLAIEEKGKSKADVASVLNTIGIVYKNLKKYQEAIDAYKEAAKIFDVLREQVDYGMCLSNIGNTYIELKNYDSAEHYLEYALKIFIDENNPVFIASLLGNLGNLHEGKGAYSVALRHHEKALAIWRANPKKRQLANCLHNLGKTYLALGKLDKAEKSYREAMTIAQAIKIKPLLADIYEGLHKLYFIQRSFENAHHYLTLSTQLKDSIFTENSTKQINELQVKFDTEKKSKQIEVLAKEKEIQQKEIQRQRTLAAAFAGGIILMICISILVYYVLRQRLLLNKKNHAITESYFKQQLTELEMKALRAQINPHFLFNCMNAINVMIRKGQDEQACQYLAKFSKLVRQILENSESPSVTLESELSLIEAYVQLEELRFPGKINYQINVEQSIGTANTYLPSMVLQPVVENAIWHGILHREQSAIGTIRIDVKQYVDTLCCSIEDNGVGREKSKQLKAKSLINTKSMGIAITEQRLRLLSRTQQANVIEILDMKDSAQHAIGTRVVLNIPIIEQ